MHAWHRIGARVSLGFLVVLVLHVSIAVVGHIGLAKAARDGEIQSRLQEDAIRIVENDAAIARLQRDVLLFTYTDHPSVADRVRATQSELLGLLERASSERLIPEHATTIEAMRTVLESFAGHFEDVRADRGLRSRLRREVLDPVGQELAGVVTDTLTRAREAGELEVAASAGACLLHCLALRNAVHDYLDDPGAEPVRRFKVARSQLDSALRELRELPLPAVDSQRVAAVLDSLSRYEQAFLQVVQATRSYLHLVNVVLAGDALEFQTLAAAFKRDEIAEIDALSRQVARDQQSFQFWSNAVSILTIVLGVLFAWLIGKTVSPPILAMTRTLTELARGVPATIPGRERKDEIGEMARAAEVFKERNQETEELLERSRELTEMHACANRRLEATVRELSKRNEDLDSFAYLASHDLKAPLRAISHLATWIEEDSAEFLPEASKEHLCTLRGRVARLDSLLEGLLQFSRAAREKYELERIDVRQFAEEVVELNAPPPGFRVSISGERPVIQSYRTPLQQVLMNLVGNAVKHHDRATGEIAIEISERGDAVEIVVSDDGPGIPQEYHERVFKMFQTLKPRDEKEASGIGLSIVQKIVDSMHGEVRIESRGDRGTRFVLTWPLRVIEEHGVGAPAEELLEESAQR